LKPRFTAITIVRIDPRTEADPFMPQAQGMNAGDVRRSQLIPSGIGIPMANPNGARNTIARAAFMGVVNPTSRYKKNGNRGRYTSVKAAMTRQAKEMFFRSLNFESLAEKKLPVPLNSKVENNTTLRA
jgi:hypothetical protein